jgi:hypothetical protein
MTCEGRAEALLTEARGLIALAASTWEAGDVPQVNEMIPCLEIAAGRIGVALEILRDEPANVGQVRDRARTVRAEFERLMRAVDLRAAFCRKLSVRLGVSDEAERFAGPASTCRLEA